MISDKANTALAKANQRVVEFKNTKLRNLLLDVIFFGGIGAIAVGIWRLPTPYAGPGALVFTGAAMIWAAMIGSRK
jgi:hypothetical protein